MPQRSIRVDEAAVNESSDGDWSDASEIIARGRKFERANTWRSEQMVVLLVEWGVFHLVILWFHLGCIAQVGMLTLHMRSSFRAIQTVSCNTLFEDEGP